MGYWGLDLSICFLSYLHDNRAINVPVWGPESANVGRGRRRDMTVVNVLDEPAAYVAIQRVQSYILRGSTPVA